MAQILSGPRRSGTGRASRDDPRTEPSREQPGALDEDATFDILRSERRRVALQCLHEGGGEASIGTLAERVAAAENDVDREAVSPSQRKRTYIALYQNHLPKLAGHGVVDFDREQGLVQLREPSRTVLAYLYYDPSANELPPVDAADESSLRRLVFRVIGR